MKILDYYKNQQLNDAWLVKFQSTSNNQSGKTFSYINTNFRGISAFFSQLSIFESKNGLKRSEWNDYQDGGQEKDKHRVINLQNAGLLNITDDRYYISDKGKEVLRIDKDTSLTEKEKWILLFLLILDYKTETRNIDLIKSVMEIYAPLTQKGVSASVFISILRKALNISNKENLFSSEAFWLITFAKDPEFIEYYLSSSSDEKMELYEWVKNCSKNKSSKDCIAHKFVSGGAYTTSTFVDDINVILSLIILLLIQDTDSDNYLRIICKIYTTCRLDKMTSYISSKLEVYKKAFDESIGYVNKILGVNKMSIDKRLYDVEKALGLTNKEWVEQTTDSDYLSKEWFQTKAIEFKDVETIANAEYKAFIDNYGPKSLEKLSGEELLNSLFLGGNADNLCHELEYVSKNIEYFGSIKGGNVYKYPLFFNRESNSWVTGTRVNPQVLSTAKAVILGEKIRDALLKGCKIIDETKPLSNTEDYISLYAKLYANLPEIVDAMWVMKYFHMIYPNIFPTFYNREWQEKVLNILSILPSETAYGRMGQINLFVKSCEISNFAFGKVFHKYCKYSREEHEINSIIELEPTIDRVKSGENIILYGVPGAGKSWTIKDEYCNDDERMERLVFHPDYTYSDFVGQILPRVGEDGAVSYEFTPGPFTKLLKKAYINPDRIFYLVIEEVNRGNAPAIFGDIFQLLDRGKDGNSEYQITNSDIAKIVYGNENHKVYIPSNMSILCTMNTSDQNVFTLDTAFQRRWSMRLIKNKFIGEEEKQFANTKILDTDITWNKFFSEINRIILSKNIRMTSSEDKRLGTHFVAKEDLQYVEGDEKQNNKFPEKVLKYLWDDAFKFTKEDIFDLEVVKSLEDVIERFVGKQGNERFRIFKENIYNTLIQ